MTTSLTHSGNLDAVTKYLNGCIGEKFRCTTQRDTTQEITNLKLKKVFLTIKKDDNLLVTLRVGRRLEVHEICLCKEEVVALGDNIKLDLHFNNNQVVDCPEIGSNLGVKKWTPSNGVLSGFMKGT